MVPILLVALKLSIALLVFGIGLRSEPRDATFLLRHPALLARTLFSMLVVMPLFAVAMFITFSLPPAVGVALVALAVSPVPPVLPSKIARASGRGEYTIGLLMLTSLLSIVTVPVSLGVIETVFHLPLHTPIGPLTKTVATSILIPMLLGIGIATAWPKTAGMGKSLSTIGTIALALGLLPLVGALLPEFEELVGDGTLLAAIAFTVTGLIAGHLLGGPQRDTQSVLALASATRHPMIAIAIGMANFPNDKLVAPAVFLVVIVSAIVTTPYVRRMGRPATPRPQNSSVKHAGAR